MRDAITTHMYPSTIPSKSTDPRGNQKYMPRILHAHADRGITSAETPLAKPQNHYPSLFRPIAMEEFRDLSIDSPTGLSLRRPKPVGSLRRAMPFHGQSRYFWSWRVLDWFCSDLRDYDGTFYRMVERGVLRVLPRIYTCTMRNG